MHDSIKPFQMFTYNNMKGIHFQVYNTRVTTQGSFLQHIFMSPVLNGKELKDGLLRKSWAWTELCWCPTEPRKQAAEPSKWCQQGGTLGFARQNSSPTRRGRIHYTSILSTTTNTTLPLTIFTSTYPDNCNCDLALNFIENNLSFPHCCICYIPKIDSIRIAGFCCNAGFWGLFFSNVAASKLQL